MFKLILLLNCFCVCLACFSKQLNPESSSETQSAEQQLTMQKDTNPLPAAANMKAYLTQLSNKKIALVVNQTSMVNQVHLVDTLQALGCQIMRVFAPEHGFRGQADAGEQIKDGFDKQTGLPIVSLYGSNKKPTVEQMQGIDLILFDIQDVGVRFYTYTSTMTYVMQACAENNVPLLVLDRPNPLGHIVDGPVLEKEQRSFVGLHPVPIIHGLTVAEYAYMINEEGWLEDGLKCPLKWVKCLHYNHSKFYQLPVRPSPNLPNMRSIYLYPHLCLFEGTTTSVGRGTVYPFQQYGHPALTTPDYFFTPKSGPGAKKPKHQGLDCYGHPFKDVEDTSLQQIKRLQLSYMMKLYQALGEEDKISFFLANNFFNKLAGNTDLMQQIKSLMPLEDIYQSWEPKLSNYKNLREQYLLYP
jgi:uncharacterized protein YbbC (DUF1343 family)